MVSRKFALLFILFYFFAVNTSCITSIVPKGTRLDTPEAIRLFSPEWSPDGRMIAYTTWQGTLGVGRVYVYDLETGENKVVREHGLNGEVKWSPNGSILLINRSDGLNAINFDSLQISTTFDGFGGGWAPDGSLFVLSRNRDDQAVELSSGDLDSGETKSITVIKESENLGSHAYSSIDNNCLVAAFGVGDVIPGTHDANDIFVFDLEGNLLFTLGSAQSDDIDPSLYPLASGWLIYAESNLTDGSVVFTNFTETCVYRAETTEELITGVSISPDGERLAVSVYGQLFVIPFEDAFGHPANEFIKICQSDSPN